MCSRCKFTTYPKKLRKPIGQNSVTNHKKNSLALTHSNSNLSNAHTQGKFDSRTKAICIVIHTVRCSPCFGNIYYYFFYPHFFVVTAQSHSRKSVLTPSQRGLLNIDLACICTLLGNLYILGSDITLLIISPYANSSSGVGIGSCISQHSSLL